jgi:hypothetical protein
MGLSSKLNLFGKLFLDVFHTLSAAKIVQQITSDGKIIPGAKRKLSINRKHQLQALLDELIESSGNIVKDKDTLAAMIDKKFKDELRNFYEIKELEKMINAQLVLKAKKSYLRKPIFGKKTLTHLILFVF